MGGTAGPQAAPAWVYLGKIVQRVLGTTATQGNRAHLARGLCTRRAEKHTEPEPWSWSLSRSQSGAGMLRSGASAMAFVGGVACSTVPAYYMLHQDVWKSQQL